MQKYYLSQEKKDFMKDGELLAISFDIAHIIEESCDGEDEEITSIFLWREYLEETDRLGTVGVVGILDNGEILHSMTPVKIDALEIEEVYNLLKKDLEKALIYFEEEADSEVIDCEKLKEILEGIVKKEED